MTKLLEFPISDSIVSSDEKDLRLYFNSGGLSVFQMSTFGAQLDRAKLFSAITRPCEACGGCVASDRLGSGFVMSKEYRDERSQAEIEADVILADRDPGLLSLGDVVCSKCNGFGFVSDHIDSRNGRPTGAVTARPTGSSKKGVGADSVSVADTNLATLGRVCRILDRVCLESPVYAEALGAYYSGNELGGVAALTPAAEKLCKKNPLKLPRQQLLVNIREEQRQKPDPNIEALLKAADEQAAQVYKEACKAWNRAKICRR
jgi:hypothetical protein